MYKVEFSKKAENQFYNLPLEIQRRIASVLDRIKFRPFHFVKRKEESSNFILRVGDYRAILDIRQKELIIYVTKVGHRKNIYD